MGGDWYHCPDPWEGLYGAPPGPAPLSVAPVPGLVACMRTLTLAGIWACCGDPWSPPAGSPRSDSGFDTPHARACLSALNLSAGEFGMNSFEQILFLLYKCTVCFIILAYIGNCSLPFVQLYNLSI